MKHIYPEDCPYRSSFILKDKRGDFIFVTGKAAIVNVYQMDVHILLL